MSSDNYPRAYLYKRVVQAKLYIDDHFFDSIDLENISDEANFSKFHFIRLFREAYGKTPHQYLIRVRVEQAMGLLQAGKTVSDACYEVGFESPGSFSALFKRVVGISPTEYRLRQLQLKALVHKTPLNFIPGCHVKMNAPKEKSNFEEAGI